MAAGHEAADERAGESQDDMEDKQWGALQSSVEFQE